jgi:hypothetical protein
MIKTSHIVFICYIRTLYMPPLISHFTVYNFMILCYWFVAFATWVFYWSHHVYYTDDTAVKYINGNITLANDLNLDIYNVMFYHLKHGRYKPLSIPIELNCKHHRLFIISHFTVYSSMILCYWFVAFATWVFYWSWV